jgi:hypothetical protein
MCAGAGSSHTPQLCGGSTAISSPGHSGGSFDVMAEIMSLRSQLQREVAERQQWMMAMASQVHLLLDQSAGWSSRGLTG